MASCMSTQEIYSKLQKKLTDELSDMRDVSDEELFAMIDEKIERQEEESFMPVSRKLKIRSRLFDSFRRLDILQELIDRDDVTEIMVNGSSEIFIEQSGRIVKWDKCFESDDQLEDMIQQIVAKVNRQVNISSPIVDARLLDGSRVHVVLPPVSLSGPVITIRKFPEIIRMKRMIAGGTINSEAAAFLKRLVRAGYNIFISGGTNSGKTTFLNALSAYIPEDERVITIEDSAELQLQQIKNLVRLEARNANAQGEGAISIADLIKASLRMNPDRIIVGEVRDAAALDMLQAMQTGHDGSLSTGHGNSCEDMLRRIETMVLSGAELPLQAVRGQIAGAIDILIHLGRLKDKSRHVLDISEIEGYENGEIKLNPIYKFEYRERGGELKKVGSLKRRSKLIASGDGLQGL